MAKFCIFLISLLLGLQMAWAADTIDSCKSTAKALLDHGKFTDTTIQYTKCVDKYGDDGESYYGIALANFYQGLFDESLFYVSKAEDLGVPDSKHLRETIGQEQFQQEDRIEKLPYHLPKTKVQPIAISKLSLVFLIFSLPIVLFIWAMISWNDQPVPRKNNTQGKGRI